MTLSPLLKFAIESFEHAIKQYMEGSDKFSVLYCDHAIELILKEKVRATGESIFEKNGRTIDFHDAINTLTNNKGVRIPEKADLELIHDQRNVVQHRGATISKDEAEFYLKRGYEFIKRFLKDELGIELGTVLQERYYQIFEPTAKKIEIGESVKVDDRAEVKEVKVTDVISAILVEYRNLEIELHNTFKRLNITIPRDQAQLLESLRILQDSNKLDDTDLWDFEYIRNLRNQAAHSDDRISENELESFMLKIQKLRNKLRVLVG